MQYNNLGLSGLKVSQLSLGAMNFGTRIDEETSFKILDKAHDLGINFIDTANAYGESETIIGKWMKKNGTRDDFIISTKVGWPMGQGVNEKGLSRRHIRKQIDASMERLQTNYIDIYQAHGVDDTVSISELAATFSQLVDKAEINVIGAPVFCKAWKILQWHYEAKMSGLNNIGFKQFPFSFLSRSMHKGDNISICTNLNIPIVNFGIIGGGLLTGNYISERKFPENGKEMMKKYHEEGRTDEIITKLTTFAKTKDISLAHLAVAFVSRQNFNSSALVGASHPDQLENIVSALDVTLSSDELEQLMSVSDDHFIW